MSSCVDMDLTRILPEDVLLEVLRHLCPRSLAVSRCVCKAWRATVDDHRANLLQFSLEGIFLELNDPRVTPHGPGRWQEYPTPVLFSRPSTGRKIPAYVGYPRNCDSYSGEYKGSILDCCNGLLLLCNDLVVNPATRQWAQLPEIPDPCVVVDCIGCRYKKYLVFDPTESPHYEVFSVPQIPDYFSPGHIGKHQLDGKSVSTMEWPPTPYIMDVFSSKTGEWEDRSFVREGKAAGTVAHCNNYSSYQGAAAYWHGALYINFEYSFVLRIKLSNNTYQLIELPKEKNGFFGRRLGKSEKGVYCAFCCGDDMFQIWFLDESRGQTKWVLKSDINLEPVTCSPCNIVCGAWILQQHYDAGELVPEDYSEWDTDDENIVSVEHWVGTHDAGTYEFLGFHPFKEIVLLTSCVSVIAYHLNTSKVRDLGYISKGWNEIQASFPYTPCWMGPLPGAAKHLIDEIPMWQLYD